MDKKIIEEIARVSKEEKWPYPKTFKALKEAGVRSYEVKTASHQITYFNEEYSFQEQIPVGFQPLQVSKNYDIKLIKQALANVRLGKTNYEGFLKEIAQAGVKFYLVDMLNNTVTYFGANLGEEYAEKVPQI